MSPQSSLSYASDSSMQDPFGIFCADSSACLIDQSTPSTRYVVALLLGLLGNQSHTQTILKHNKLHLATPDPLLDCGICPP